MIKLYNKIYNQIIKIINLTNSLLILFFVSISEAIFFPIPPDIFIISMIIFNKKNIYKIIITASIGSLIGGVLGYMIGYYFWWNGETFSTIANLFFNYIPGFTKDLFYNIKLNYNTYGNFIVFTAGFTPIPFKIFTIASGAFKLPVINFLVFSFLSRFLRFAIVSILIFKYGNKMKHYISQYFNILSLLFVFIILIIILILDYI